MTLEDRLLGQVEADTNGGCWLWRGALNRPGWTGYGVTWEKRRPLLAHRAAWLAWRGPIPPGRWVLHRCDVRQCVNPDHLFLGTRADNQADMVAKGRHLYGERNTEAKLTEASVKAIKAGLRAGCRYNDLAALHGVAMSTISMISSGRRWAHVQ